MPKYCAIRAPPRPNGVPFSACRDHTMTDTTLFPTVDERDVPELWRGQIQSRLLDSERILGWIQTDLDHRLHFERGLVAVTNLRLLACRESGAEWAQWGLQPGLSLRKRDHAAVGTLEIVDGNACLDSWRYTLGHDPSAQRLIDAHTAATKSLSSGIDSPLIRTVCPGCRAELPEGQQACIACASAPEAAVESAPSTWVLLRLWRFARPYRGQLALGFLLTVAATAATLVAPYLTMPLMDKVLIPYQKGVPIDPMTVGMYMGGLLGAALLAWVLGRFISTCALEPQ